MAIVKVFAKEFSWNLIRDSICSYVVNELFSAVILKLHKVFVDKIASLEIIFAPLEIILAHCMLK